MARRLFFVDQVRNGSAEIGGEDASHLVKVLRVEPGQRYEISDNRQLYLAEVESARKSSVEFRVVEKLPMRDAPVRIHLHMAIIKFDHFEWVLEKATELDVERITP
ncbi:MAG: RsmE family RNA methyltransferase, partial [Candidatus Solibacter usitatus]|nr:RsmE family RNA methyltransferase [Candidatus Solibacter usitatus]